MHIYIHFISLYVKENNILFCQRSILIVIIFYSDKCQIQ